MNAPQDLQAHTIRMLPLELVAPSANPAQARRRVRFSRAALEELTASVREVGVRSPILVRPMAGGLYEIVFGERRYLASKLAGLHEVPAVVREVADADVALEQITENRHRETLHPLDEADAIEELIAARKISAEEAGALLGLSRAHVYNRLKLLTLAPPVIEALDNGTISATVALRIARVPVPKLQAKALKYATQPLAHNGEKPGERAVGEYLRDEFMVRLDSVPFDLADASLPPLACTKCDHFSRNDDELDAEVVEAHGAGATLCTNKPCHDQKVIAFHARRVDAAREAGRKIIEGDDAKSLKPWAHDRHPQGFVDLDQPCEYVEEPEGAAEDWQPPTYRELVGDKLARQAALFVDPARAGTLDVLPEADVAKALKKKGIDYAIGAPDGDIPISDADATPEAMSAARRRIDEEQAAKRAREDLERAVRRRLLDQVHAKWKGPLKREDLAALVDWLLEQYDLTTLPIFDWYYAGRIDTAKMKEGQLALLLMEIIACNSVEYLGDSPAHLLVLAKRLKIDPAKVEKAVRAELGQGDDEKPAKKAGGKKKAKRR